MTTAYIITKDFHGEKMVAQVDTDAKSGTIVEYGHVVCDEEINANRDYNLVNPQSGKISRAKKWEKEYIEFFAEEVNPGQYRVI